MVENELQVVVLQLVQLSYIMATNKDSHQICKLNLYFGKLLFIINN